MACFDRIWQTTKSLPSSLTASLEEQAATLATPLRSYYDTSIDIVDPYCYPVVHGRTPALTKEGLLNTTPQLKMWFYAFSTRFSYLPTAFSISGPSEPCRATSEGYINGVPPHMPSMVENIETVISNAIPLFENVLTDLHRNNPLQHRISGGSQYEGGDAPAEPAVSDDDEAWWKYDQAMQEWSANRPLVLPDVAADGFSQRLDARKHRVSLRGRTVNVVTRMTEIRLVSAHGQIRAAIKLSTTLNLPASG